MPFDKKIYNAKYHRDHKEEVRTYHKEYDAEYRKNHKEEARVRNEKRYNEHRAWLTNIKTSRGCALCPETHPAVLVFHHRDPNMKSFDMARNAWRKKERILEEIKKCDVLCANCHRKLHWEEDNGKLA